MYSSLKFFTYVVRPFQVVVLEIMTLEVVKMQFRCAWHVQLGIWAMHYAATTIENVRQ
jgi:hypothetical protein